MARVHVTYSSLSRADVIERLRELRVRLKRTIPVSRMILFGSYAQGRHTAGSDIDLVVVYKGPEEEDAYKMIMNEARLPTLELRVYTEDQFKSLLEASPMFASVLAKEGVEIVEASGRGW